MLKSFSLVLSKSALFVYVYLCGWVGLVTGGWVRVFARVVQRRIYIYIYMHIYIFINAYTHTHTHTHTHILA
jgi:hypothetical protein